MEAGMGEEAEVSLQENGLTFILQEERKEKKKKKKKKGSLDGGDESHEGNEERPGKLNQEEKGKAGNEDLASDIKMSLEKESHKDGGDIKKKKKKNKKRTEDVSGDSEGKAVTDEEGDGKKQKKKKLKITDLSDVVEVEAEANEESGKSKKENKTSIGSVSDCVGDEADMSEKVEKSKKKKLKSTDLVGGVEVEAEATTESGKSKKEKKTASGKSEKEKKTDAASVSDSVGDEAEEVEKRKKKEKKRKLGDISSAGEEDKDEDDNHGKKKKKNGKKIAENPSAKRVTFSDNVEVSEEVPYKKARPPKKNIESVDGLVRGKRFTPEEDALIKDAVSKYIEEHNLGENGIDMILKCHSHKHIQHCWKEIAKALPHRPLVSVYYRGHVIYERGNTSEWTVEDREYVKEFYKTNGADWKTLANELNRHRNHVKEAWRRNRLENCKRGRWDQQEYQNLFDLVNKDLSMRAHEERISKHGMLRDNIAWDAISDGMATRYTSNCCHKWYSQLTSPLVAQGVWSDTDDYRLINALVELDASNADEVDWDSLLEHRDGETALKRWNQMVKHLGNYSNTSFAEQVEVLGQRYAPKSLPDREEFDSKPFADC